jgi:hypothetical protein
MPNQQGRKQVGKQKGPVNTHKITLDVRESNTASLEEFAKSLPNITNIDDSIAIYNNLVSAKYRNKSITIDTGKQFVSWKPVEDHTNIGILTYKENGILKDARCFQKTIPLIDNDSWMKDKERPSYPFSWGFQKDALLNPENQAYVDVVATAFASKLREITKSPHFCEFYGAFRGVSKEYLHNLMEDFEEYRFTKWFWKGVENGEYNLRIIEKGTERRLSLQEIILIFKPDEDFLHDDDECDEEDDASSNGDTSSILSAESLRSSDGEPQTPFVSELEEARSIPSSSDSNDIPERNSSTPKTISTIQTASSGSSNESDFSFTEEYSMFVELNNMPVVVMYCECMEDTMDSLLENKEFVPATTVALEERWTAWLFQVIVACTQLQGYLHLTHNDLHTNNVLFTKTSDEYIYYHDSQGHSWSIPTFGYVFKIIDFGRAIFTNGGYTVISSDYNDGHFACGMYNFGPIQDDAFAVVRPNKSFDLCRLSCSVLRGLYPSNPPSILKGAVITKEKNWEVRETSHPLFNMLWGWLKNKLGHNILEEESGVEKYPGFDLYTTIASTANNAIPSEQLSKPLFQTFMKQSVDKIKSVYIPL